MNTTTTNTSYTERAHRLAAGLPAPIAAKVLGIITSPSVHWPVKEAILTGLDRDPVDAKYDALLVAEVLGAVCDARLGRSC